MFKYHLPWKGIKEEQNDDEVNLASNICYRFDGSAFILTVNSVNNVKSLIKFILKNILIYIFFFKNNRHMALDTRTMNGVSKGEFLVNLNSELTVFLGT